MLTEGLGMLAATSGREEFLVKKRCGATSAAPRGSRSGAATPPVPTCRAQRRRTLRRGFGAAHGWSCARRAAARRSQRAPRARRAQAETLCEQGQDPVCLDEAKKLLRTSDGR